MILKLLTILLIAFDPLTAVSENIGIPPTPAVSIIPAPKSVYQQIYEKGCDAITNDPKKLADCKLGWTEKIISLFHIMRQADDIKTLQIPTVVQFKKTRNLQKKFLDRRTQNSKDSQIQNPKNVGDNLNATEEEVLILQKLLMVVAGYASMRVPALQLINWRWAEGSKSKKQSAKEQVGQGQKFMERFMLKNALGVYTGQILDLGKPVPIDKNVRLFWIIIGFIAVSRNMYSQNTIVPNLSHLETIFQNIYIKGKRFYNVFTKDTSNDQRLWKLERKSTMEMLENVWKKLRSTKGDAHKMVKGLRMIEGPIWKMWMDNTEVVSIKSCKTVFTRVIEGKELAKYAQYCDTWGKGINWYEFADDNTVAHGEDVWKFIDYFWIQVRSVFQQNYVERLQKSVIGLKNPDMSAAEIENFKKWVERFKLGLFDDIKWYMTREINVLTPESRAAIYEAGKKKDFNLKPVWVKSNPLEKLHKVIIEQLVVRYSQFLAESWQMDNFYNQFIHYFSYNMEFLGRGSKVQSPREVETDVEGILKAIFSFQSTQGLTGGGAIPSAIRIGEMEKKYQKHTPMDLFEAGKKKIMEMGKSQTIGEIRMTKFDPKNYTDYWGYTRASRKINKTSFSVPNNVPKQPQVKKSNGVFDQK